LNSNQIFHSGTYEHTSDNDANDVYSILPVDTGIFVGSKAGMWKLVGSYAATYNQGVHETIKGKVVDLRLVDYEGTPTIFAATDPGRFANIALIDPGNNDSDFDSIPDGWEYAYGLDPTDIESKSESLLPGSINAIFANLPGSVAAKIVGVPS
jgi:hypothetical protein